MSAAPDRRAEAERRGDPYLAFTGEGGEERVLALSAGCDRVRIGRDRSAELPLGWDGEVSRWHAELTGDGRRWAVADTGSRNGTFVGGERISGPHSLADGDELRVGSTVIRFRAPGARTRARVRAAEPGGRTVVAPPREIPRGVSGVHAASYAVTGEPEAEAGGPVGRLGGEPSGTRAIPADRIQIGRDPDNDLVVDDLLVSRHHATLQRGPGGRWELLDAGSANGTFVNGRRVERAVLEELDVVAVGHHMFRLVGSQLEEYIDEGSISFEADGLTVRVAGEQTLLDRVSFGLEQRSFLAVVGPSGAGKSTLLNALTGFRPAHGGTVLYDGRDLYREYDELRLRLGFVPQQDIMHAGLTVREALGYAAELRFPDDVDPDAREARVGEVLVDLGLDRAADRRVEALSGGQRRRVAMGLELLTKPSLLFLDEPTSGLDPGLERNVMELLRRLADGGRTVITVTHSVESIRLCDRVLFLAPGGRTAYFGPPQLAPAYFEREDFQEVFMDLSADQERDWQGAFRSHAYFDRFAAPPALPAGAPSVPEDEPGSGERTAPSSPNPRARLGQVRLLARRYARVILSDRRNLLLLGVQPILLGLLMMIALPAGELGSPELGEVRAVSRAGLVLLVVILGATWLGASNAVREIVKEAAIVRREQAVGLSVTAYISSKVIVLGALTSLQCAVLASIALARQGAAGSGALLPSMFAELVGVAILAGLAGMTLGLLISALARTAEQAMTLLPIVLVLQMLLALGGVFPDLVEKPGLKQASFLASGQWALSTSASSVDLERLQTLDRIAREAPTVRLDDPLSTLQEIGEELRAEPRWSHDGGTWIGNAGALGGLTLVGALGAGLIVSRRRPEA